MSSPKCRNPSLLSVAVEIPCIGTVLAMFASQRLDARHDLDEGGSMVLFRQLCIAITLIVGGQVGLALEAQAFGEPLSLAAAPSLKVPFEEIVPLFEQEYGVPVRVQYGASHTLRRQIEQGASIDVFLPESSQELETLHQKGLTLLGGPREYAQSSLVLVMSSASAATAISFSDASANGALRVALVDPKASSVGVIAFRALKQIAPLLQHRPRFLPADHTDDVVRLVSAGHAELLITARNHLNRRKVWTPRLYINVQAGGFVIALLLGDVEAGELRLVEPFQSDRDGFVRVGSGHHSGQRQGDDGSDNTMMKHDGCPSGWLRQSSMRDIK